MYDDLTLMQAKLMWERLHAPLLQHDDKAAMQ